MVDIISILILVVGVLIGSSAAGVIAHAMNYVSDLDKNLKWGILSIYVVALTFGLGVDYGHPIIIFITSFIGIVIIGGQIFNRVKDRLPHEITIRQE
jgi:chromate transport protein ChrA